MKYFLLISCLFCACVALGQKPTNISGRVVDENADPVSKATIYFQGDTAYSDDKGYFKIAYPNPQQFWYALIFQKDGFFDKTRFVDLTAEDVVIKEPVFLRSRKGFWYDKEKIDSTGIGITVAQAIKKYKLASDECLLRGQPFTGWRGFETELADSSPIYFSIRQFYDERMLKMEDILNCTIIGIGITDMQDREIIIGKGYAPKNLYLQERYIRNESLKRKEE